MSRSKTGSKSPGYEFWSRRPGSTGAIGKEAKVIIHRIERQRSKQLVRKELNQME